MISCIILFLLVFNSTLLILLFFQHTEIAELRQECNELRIQNANLERIVRDVAYVSSLLLVLSILLIPF